MAWREDMRRTATGTQFNAGGLLALGDPPSRAWAGYWQRHRRKEDLRHAACSAIRHRTPWPAPYDATSPRLLRRFNVSLTFHWTWAKAARSAGSSPFSIITAPPRIFRVKPALFEVRSGLGATGGNRTA